MSELRTNRIIPRDGLPSGASGGIIQTVFAFSDTKIETSVDADIISASITPSTSSSKILLCTLVTHLENTEGREWAFVAYRGSTQIRLGRDESSNSRATFAFFDNVAVNSNSNGSYTITGILVDEPNTTSAVTYKLAIEQFYTSGTTAIVKIGESGWDGTGIEQVTNGYSLTLMEISG